MRDTLDTSVTHVVRLGPHDHNARELTERAIAETRVQPLHRQGLWQARGSIDSPAVYFLGMLQLTRALGDTYMVRVHALNVVTLCDLLTRPMLRR